MQLCSQYSCLEFKIDQIRWNSVYFSGQGICKGCYLHLLLQSLSGTWPQIQTDGWIIWLSERIKVNDKLYFPFLPARLRVSELGKGISEEIMGKNKTNQTSTSIKSMFSNIKSVNLGPSKPERMNSKTYESRQTRKRKEQSSAKCQAIGSGEDCRKLKRRAATTQLNMWYQVL